MSTLTRDDWPNSDNHHGADDRLAERLAEHLATVDQRDVLSLLSPRPFAALPPSEQQRYMRAAKLALHYVRPAWVDVATTAVAEGLNVMDRRTHERERFLQDHPDPQPDSLPTGRMGDARTLVSAFTLALIGETLSDDERDRLNTKGR
jgi:hypothetical protein